MYVYGIARTMWFKWLMAAIISYMIMGSIIYGAIQVYHYIKYLL